MTAALKSLNSTIGEAATRLQDTASAPAHSVWVGASAGTGKTKVLTDRVLRLLLPETGKNDGTPPEKILCITYTKAGATEMVTRIMNTLSKWAVCDQSALETSLKSLLGDAPTLKQTDKARRLFANVVDLPQGLKINTIHAFCQSVLGRFPLEANLSPNFQLMENGEEAALLAQARNDLMEDIKNNRADLGVATAFQDLAQNKDGQQINSLLRALVGQRRKIMGLEDAKTKICAALDIHPDDTPQKCLRNFFEADFADASITTLIQAFDHGAATNKKESALLRSFIAMPLTEKIASFDSYKSVFLNSKDELYADSHVTKGALAHTPNALYLFQTEAKRILAMVDHLKSLRMAQSTIGLLAIARDIISRYETLKTGKNYLDYDDLIARTRDLLYARTDGGSPMNDWVLFKLDGGIDHILVDEAQDTNALQWQIILKLVEDFFTGIGLDDDRETQRSLFVVGDEKQSIYRFQGAEPQIFDAVKADLTRRAHDAQKSWQDVPMATSFRSVSAVLDFVDAIFSQDSLRGTITQKNDTVIKHTAFRVGDAGRVDIWPIYQAPKPPMRAPWTLPLAVCPSYNSQAALAGIIAMQIATWVNNKHPLIAKNRALTAGDIMILVRRRNSFVDHLIRALKTHKIPVSGVDRMVISTQIGVQDIISVLSFALMPDDDLALAEVLKSPFIGWDDARLEDIAFPREKSLWEAIKSSAPPVITQWLNDHVESVSKLSSFDMIQTILVRPTPNQTQSGWKAIISRLGDDAVDAIEELLSMAQRYDMQSAEKSIQGFVHFMTTDQRELKREMDNAQDMVRIMTVHAAKGLQAPVVFLPDTCGLPRPPALSDNGFIWTDDGIPLWSRSTDDANEVYNALRDQIKHEDWREYNRLLYVAMTRAEDRLVICGYIPPDKKEIPEGCWYKSILSGVSHLPTDYCQTNPWDHDPDYTVNGAETLIFEQPQEWPIPEAKPHVIARTSLPSLPEWTSKIMAAEQHPPKTLMPSKMADEDVPVRSPLRQADDSHRFRRGLLTHSLLQYLPDIPRDSWEKAAQDFMERQAPDIPATLQNDIIKESLTVLKSPQFSQFFGAGSQAEVAITGRIENPHTGKIDIVSGQIDRLLITNDAIWIVDYKSNRPPPRDAKDIPAAYRAQLGAYRMLMADIYPNHKIHTALLWTDGPFMMEING